MKTLQVILLLSFLGPTVFAKILIQDDKVLIRANGKQTPLFLVNKLLKENAISNFKLYGEGDLHVISFATKDLEARLYTVDEKGFIYSLKPFTSYNIDSVDSRGSIHFKELPKKKFSISDKGLFVSVD